MSGNSSSRGDLTSAAPPPDGAPLTKADIALLLEANNVILTADLVHIPGYNSARCDRHRRNRVRGGGVFMYWVEHLQEVTIQVSRTRIDETTG